MAAESAGSGARYPVKIIRYEKGGRKRKKKLERSTMIGLATRALANSPELTPAWAAMRYGPSRPAVGLECGSGISTFRRLIAWGNSRVFSIIGPSRLRLHIDYPLCAEHRDDFIIS